MRGASRRKRHWRRSWQRYCASSSSSDIQRLPLLIQRDPRNEKSPKKKIMELDGCSGRVARLSAAGSFAEAAIGRWRGEVTKKCADRDRRRRDESSILFCSLCRFNGARNKGPICLFCTPPSSRVGKQSVAGYNQAKNKKKEGGHRLAAECCRAAFKKRRLVAARAVRRGRLPLL